MEQVKEWLKMICNCMISQKDVLTDIDSRLGDGDMGISMEKGAIAVNKILDEYRGTDISAMLMLCASEFNRAAPSTMGTLLSFSLMAVAAEWKGQEEITVCQIMRIPGIMAETIGFRGKAKEGDKTVLDALIPFGTVLASVYNQTQDVGRALEEASAAAAAGRERTKGIVAKAGRAKWLAERNMDCPDGGAVLCAAVAERLLQKWQTLHKETGSDL